VGGETVTNSSDGRRSDDVVLNVDGVCDWDWYVDWCGHGHWVGHSEGLGYGIWLWDKLVVDWGDFPCLVDGLRHGDIVGPLDDLELGPDLGDLRGVAEDGAAESLHWDALDQDLRGGSVTCRDGGGDVEVDVGVSCDCWGYGRSNDGMRGGSYNGWDSSCSVGYRGGGSEDWESVDVNGYFSWFWEFVGYLSEFSLHGVSWDSNWSHGVCHGNHVSYLLQLHSCWHMSCYLMLHSCCIRQSCGVDCQGGCGNAGAGQQR